jgi:hypothetical protein
MAQRVYDRKYVELQKLQNGFEEKKSEINDKVQNGPMTEYRVMEECANLIMRLS